MSDHNNVYVARAGVVYVDGERFQKKDSPYCNPYKIGRDGIREEVLQKYDLMLRSNPELVEKAKVELNGKKLGCWCKLDKCHTDILLKYINQS